MDYSMHLHHFESQEDEDEPFDMEEPNFFLPWWRKQIFEAVYR